MFRFESVEYLYGLLLIPILIGIFWLAFRARQRALQQFGDTRLLKELVPNLSKYKHISKFVFLLLALVFLIVGWSNPQWGTKKEKVKRKSIDVMLALDISQSMLATDIPPSRMDRARRFTSELIEQLKGERIGLIIFAGNAYLQMPLTTDYAAAQLFTQSANPDMAPSQGTAIVDAIDLAERSFGEENEGHKVLIIITDGENHDDEALQRAKEANKKGMLIFTVGVGTSSGSFIPINVGGRQDYKRDETGNPVRSKLNENMLTELALEGEGGYFHINASRTKIFEALTNSIDKLEKKEYEQRSFNQYESYFQYFVFIGLLFLIIEFLLSYQQNKWLGDRRLF